MSVNLAERAETADASGAKVAQIEFHFAATSRPLSFLRERISRSPEIRRRGWAGPVHAGKRPGVANEVDAIGMPIGPAIGGLRKEPKAVGIGKINGVQFTTRSRRCRSSSG